MGKVFGLGAVSGQGARVDAVFLMILVVGVFFFLLTQGLLIYFAVKYRRRSPDRDNDTPQITENRVLEFFWILIPSIVVVVIFYYGWRVYTNLHEPEPGAMEVYVNGRQWLYEVKYPDGRTEINEIHVPAGKPVKFILSASDVIHGFYLPDFREKMDMIPGRTTFLWLQPAPPGRYQIFCSVYCGTGHSTMGAHLVVMPAADYEKWAAHETGEGGEGKEHEPLAARGERIVRKAGCLNCHSIEGPVKVGPDWKGIYGRKVHLQDGKTVTADEDYLRESVVDPGAKIVKGFPNVMPTYKTTLSKDDVDAVVAYLKTLK